MLKRCNTCHEEKLLSEFRKDKSKADGRRYECKVCSRLYHKSAYMEKYADRVQARFQKRYQTVKEKVLQLRLNNPCMCCGESEPACLEFHHLDPSQKEFGVTSSSNRSWDKMWEEIQKCVVLCANCHRKVHAGLITLVDPVDITPL